MIKTQKKHSLGKNLPQSFLNEFEVSGPKRSSSNFCTKNDFVVDFASLDDYFIFPKSYNIFMCTDGCSLHQINLASQNTYMHGYYRQSVPNSTHIPRPYCVPKTFTPVSFFVCSGQTYSVKHFGDIVCECK